MKRFKQIYLDPILELSEKSTVYHRNTANLKIGSIMTAAKAKKGGKHWLARREDEQLIEDIRRKYYKNKPSRFDCIYSSVIPKARFMSKGALYELKPLGKMHMTNSKIIDDMSTLKDLDDKIAAAHKYWNPSSDFLTKRNIIDIEVLSDKALVLRKVDDEWNNGDRVRLKTECTVIWYAYGLDDNTKLSDEEIEQILKHKSIKSYEEEQGISARYKVTFKKGTKGEISRVKYTDKERRSPDSGPRKYLVRFDQLDLRIDGIKNTNFSFHPFYVTAKGQKPEQSQRVEYFLEKI